MSNRFHNKYHRHNHHTDSTNDPRYPDAGHDPIASPESPFLGDFVMLGQLSATQEDSTKFAASFTNSGGGVGVNIETFGTALLAKGDVNIIGNLFASNINFTGEVLTTLNAPVTAGNEFLIVQFTNPTTGQTSQKAIRLWDF
jgi:hypothetical protein